MLKIQFVLLSSLGLAVLASAQSFSSFSSVTSISGVDVDAINSLDYKVTLDSGAKMVWGGNTFDITQVFGFFQLSSTDSLGNPTGSDISGWKFVAKSDNSGQIAGWDHNSNNGRLNAGQSQQFDYSTITPSNLYGFHFSYLDGGSTKTGYFAGPQSGSGTGQPLRTRSGNPRRAQAAPA